MIQVAILGNGIFGRALFKRAKKVKTFSVVLASRRHKDRTKFNVVSYEEAISKSDIIIFAVPHEAHQEIVREFAEILAGKIVVDVSNRKGGGTSQQLTSLLPSSSIVKALNTLSAYAIDETSSFSFAQVPVCSNNQTSKDQVMKFLSELKLQPYDGGDLEDASYFENLPYRFYGHKWLMSLIVTMILWIPILIYSMMRDIHHKEDYPWYHLALHVFNKAVAWESLALFTACYGLSPFIQLYKELPGKDHSLELPRWCEVWLSIRKEMGLIAFWMVLLHACASCLLFTGNYFWYLFGEDGKLTESAEPAMMLGLLSTGLYGLLAVTSLPSVQQQMSWKEFHFMNSKVGWAALILGTLHPAVKGHGIWSKESHSYWPSLLPPVSMMSTIVPMFVIGVKVVLILVQIFKKAAKTLWKITPGTKVMERSGAL